MPSCRPRLLLALALLMAGCGSTVSSAPVVTDADAEFDPRLIGEWEGDDGSIFVVTRLGDPSPPPGNQKGGNAYAIAYTSVVEAFGERSQAETGHFEARLGGLGGRRVLDVQPAFQVPDPYEYLVIPAHLLFVIELVTDDELHLMRLRTDVVFADVRSGTLALSYTVTGDDPSPDQLVLHAGTEKLRQELATYLDRPGVLSDPLILIRHPSPK